MMQVQTFLSLTLIAVIPVVASIILWILFQTPRFRNLSYASRQTIAGIVFGIIAIFGTEFGVQVGGAVINVRDAAPLCAGLLFGAPAGIISGFIGGIERWFAVYWGSGYYTRLACTISTCLTGIIAAVLRKYMFDDKPAKWHEAFMVGMVAEDIHMLMIFFTNMKDLKRAFTYVQLCTAPMVIINAAAVGAAAFAIRRISRHSERKKALASISDKFSKHLLLTVLMGFAATTAFSYLLQNRIYASNTGDLLQVSLQDAAQDVLQQRDDALLHVNELAMDYITQNPDADLKELTSVLGVREIDVTDQNGVITASTIEEHVGLRLADISCPEFYPLLNGMHPKKAAQQFKTATWDSSLLLMFSGIKAERVLVLTAFDAEQVNDQTSQVFRSVASNRHIGEEGSLLLLNDEYQVLSSSPGAPVPSAEALNTLVSSSSDQAYAVSSCEVSGMSYYCMYTRAGDYILVGMIPQDEADFAKSLSSYLPMLMQTVIFGAVFAVIFIAIKFLIVNNIRNVNKALGQITEGNLDTVVDVRATSEFNTLSDDINSTVDTLKHYITEANQRIDNELRYAKAIQSSALPSVFPYWEEFEIYALMDPAKEVGGDFYDFYLIGKNYLAFLVADVSGKGIPASLFMMRAKTTLKTFAENNISVADIFTNANYALCEGNDAGLFVTAWMGLLDLTTGELRYANAGHESPLIRRKNGQYKYLRCRPGFVLGGMDGISFREEIIKLEPGDEIFLYTDGVVEAMNKDMELYGESRLNRTINSHLGENAESICKGILKDVNQYYDGTPQFDDITELCVRFKKYSTDQA